MTGRRVLVIATLGLLLVGCTPPSRVELSPEAAVGACEASTAVALRARQPEFDSVVLDPAATSRVERRSTRVGRQPIELVVAGNGIARFGADRSTLRYLCLVAHDGSAVFVDVQTVDGGQILAECGPSAAPSPERRACLGDLLRKAERGLAEAEAKAVTSARGARPRVPRAEVEEPVATSIGAWRVYRDAECTRRQEAGPALSPELREACRIELTRQRVHELGG
jgi:uncharacterized protein YecT (DUF1311 family)